MRSARGAYRLFLILALACALVTTPLTDGRSGDTTAYVRGVNLSGAEFGKVPGRANFDYIWPSNEDIARYASRGVTIIRLPFKWERLQPRLHGALDSAETARLDATVARITSRGIICLIDLHNYGWYVIDGKKHVVGSPAVPISALVDVWTRLAPRYKDNARVWFGIMNEPHSIPAEQWRDAAQAVMTAIRKTGAGNKVLVPGTAFSTASNWISSGNARAMQDLQDPGNNFAFEVHQYLNRAGNGTNGKCANGAGARRLLSFERWLGARGDGVKAFLGEFGGGDSTVPGQANCKSELTSLLSEIERHKDLWLGWTVWGGGSRWGLNYHFRLEMPPETPGKTNLMQFYEQYWKSE